MDRPRLQALVMRSPMHAVMLPGAAPELIPPTRVVRPSAIHLRPLIRSIEKSWSLIILCNNSWLNSGRWWGGDPAPALIFRLLVKCPCTLLTRDFSWLAGFLKSISKFCRLHCQPTTASDNSQWLRTSGLYVSGYTLQLFSLVRNVHAQRECSSLIMLSTARNSSIMDQWLNTNETISFFRIRAAIARTMPILPEQCLHQPDEASDDYHAISGV